MTYLSEKLENISYEEYFSFLDEKISSSGLRYLDSVRKLDSDIMLVCNDSFDYERANIFFSFFKALREPYENILLIIKDDELATKIVNKMCILSKSISLILSHETMAFNSSKLNWTEKTAFAPEGEVDITFKFHNYSKITMVKGTAARINCLANINVYEYCFLETNQKNIENIVKYLNENLYIKNIIIKCKNIKECDTSYKIFS